MNNLMLAGAIVAPIAVGASAVGGYNLYQQQAEFNRARIINVAQVTKMEKVPFKRQECHQEEVVKIEKKKTESEGWKAGSTALGAVIGGAIGNQVGDGRGKKLATVAGAAVGGKIGHDVYKETHKPEEVKKVTQEERCTEVTDYRNEEKPAGFDVTYEYRGKTYTTRMDKAPEGEYLKVEEEMQLRVSEDTAS